jgi:hypothetical protein
MMYHNNIGTAIATLSMRTMMFPKLSSYAGKTIKLMYNAISMHRVGEMVIIDLFCKMFDLT